MKKRFVSLLLAGLMTAVSLVGCGSAADSTSNSSSDSSSSSSNGGDVTITYALWDSNQEKGIRTMADEFEKSNPGIKINLQVVGWSDYWTMLEAAATGGSLLDTFWMHSNEIYRYASNDMLMDLSDRIKKSDKIDLSNYPEELSKIYNQKGKQYAIPKDYDTIGLWYNKKMFDDAGVSYPDDTWTWDTLKDAAKKLTKEDGSQYGFLAPLHNQEGYYNFVYQNGGTIITDDKVSGYDNPKTIEAMDYYVSFIKEKLSPQIFGDSERAETLQNGLCAMGLFGSWNLSGFTENEYMKNNFDVAVLPKGNDGTRASIFNGLGNAISANTKHPEESWKWVEFLGSKEGQTRQGELGVAIPAYNGTADSWVASNKTYNIKAFIDMVEYAQIRPYSNTTTKWEDKAYEVLKDSFTGDRTVEEACKDTAKMMNECLKEEK